MTEDKLIRFANADALANNPGSNAIIQAPLSTGNAQPGRIVFKTGTVGAAGAALQAAAVRLTITDVSLLVDATVQLNIAQDRGARFDNQTSGFGIAAGTLLNAPVAGDPNHWLKISIGGVNHVIPCWLG